MGVLTDIFAATDAEASAVSPDDVPIQIFPGVEAKGLDPVKFGTLQHILIGTDVQEAIRQHELVREVSEEGPWITRVPQQLYDAIAAMNGDHVREVADKWSQTEEFQLDRWSKADVEDVLTRLIQLAKDARGNGKRLFVWTCL